MRGTVVIQDAVLKGCIVPSAALSGKVMPNATLSGKVVISTGHDTYSGPYTVTPKVDSQILETEDKLMRQDVTISAIPYFSVSNASNGETVIIGGTI